MLTLGSLFLMMVTHIFYASLKFCPQWQHITLVKSRLDVHFICFRTVQKLVATTNKKCKILLSPEREECSFRSVYHNIGTGDRDPRNIMR